MVPVQPKKINDMKQFDAEKFRRDVFLAAEPSIDIYTAENVNCTKHTITMAKYQEILKEHEVYPGTREYGACNEFMLFGGPTVVD